MNTKWQRHTTLRLSTKISQRFSCIVLPEFISRKFHQDCTWASIIFMFFKFNFSSFYFHMCTWSEIILFPKFFFSYFRRHYNRIYDFIFLWMCFITLRRANYTTCFILIMRLMKTAFNDGMKYFRNNHRFQWKFLMKIQFQTQVKIHH